MTNLGDLPDFSLNNRLALVTGSTQGLGLVIAKAYAASGARVIINGRNPDHVARAVAALSSQGCLAYPFVHDIARPGDYVVCLGAGTITNWAYALPAELAALD